ncbi:hypothetical protein KC352_g1601, partial [Hortaea werneckii]
GGGEGSSTEQVVNNTDGNTDQDHSTTTKFPLLAPTAAPAYENDTGFHHHHHPGGFDGPAGHALDGYDNSRDHSYENLPSGARSPAEASDTSHFTSISQRPVNPNWRPSPPSVGGGTGPPSMYGPHHQGMMGPAGGRPGYGGNGNPGPGSTASAVQRRKEDAILTANPDFTLPGLGPSARSGPRGGFRGGRNPAGARGGRSRGGGFMPPPGSGVGAGTPGVPPLGSEVGPPTSLLARGGDGPMSQGLSAGGVGLTPSGPYPS